MIGYTDEAALTAYAAARGVTLTSDAAVLLTKALDYIELQSFAGEKTDPDQVLEWPRTGVTGVADDAVPQKIVTAQLVCALIYDSGGDPMAPIGPRVTQETVVGAVSVSYSDSGPISQIYTQLNALLAPYLSGVGGTQFKVGRA